MRFNVIGPTYFHAYADDDVKAKWVGCLLKVFKQGKLVREYPATSVLFVEYAGVTVTV